MENESCMKDILSNALEQVRTIMDADTIVGKQITTPSGVVIIPISKVAMGFASGGVDIPVKTATQKGFGGGGGTGVTVAPIGFLIISPNGKVEMLPMIPEKSTPIEQVADIINTAPDLIERVKKILFSSDKEETAKDDQAELDIIEEEYRRKLAEQKAAVAVEEVKQIIEENEKVLETEEKLSKEDKKRLQKEAKELKKMEKQARKNGTAIGSSVGTDETFANETDSGKHGKLSQKTLQKGQF